jgi:hypothetical protein
VRFDERRDADDFSGDCPLFSDQATKKASMSSMVGSISS